MKIDFGVTVSEAWALFRRDREVLIALAGAFLFLPTLVLLLLVPAAPQQLASGATEAEMSLFVDNYVGWFGANGRWFVMGTIVSLYGGLSICCLYLDRQQADVRAVLLRSLALLPRYLLASLIILIPASLGALAFVFPGLYILGRTLLVAPVLVAEPPVSAVAAIQRSIALTRQNGLVLAGLSGLGLLAGQLLPAPLLAIEEGIRRARAANPIAIFLIDSGAAALAAAVALAMILLRVSIYRRLTSARRGI